MYVYQITNLINNKIYIGITNNYKKRWDNHKASAKNPKQAISFAIKKYGIENFKFELLFSHLSIEEASDKEIQLIKEKNSLTPNGYNVAKGGMYIITDGLKGEQNGRAKLTDEQAQYIKDHRNIPEYVLYEEFNDIISYNSFKLCYLGKTYSHLTTETPIYPFNLEFSNQFTSNNKLEYDDIINLRKQYAEGVHWEEAFKPYQHLFIDKWSFWNIYVGNSYKLVMPEVFTEENKHKHHSLSCSGERNGRAKLTKEDVIKIRELSEKEKLSNSEIYKLYPQITPTSIRNILNYKTWTNI